MVHIKKNIKIDNVLILNNTKISSISRNASTDDIFVCPGILIHFPVDLICALLLLFPTWISRNPGMACLVSGGGVLVFLENQSREIQNAFNIKPHLNAPWANTSTLFL